MVTLIRKENKRLCVLFLILVVLSPSFPSSLVIESGAVCVHVFS